MGQIIYSLRSDLKLTTLFVYVKWEGPNMIICSRADGQIGETEKNPSIFHASTKNVLALMQPAIVVVVVVLASDKNTEYLYI